MNSIAEKISRNTLLRIKNIYFWAALMWSPIFVWAGKELLKEVFTKHQIVFMNFPADLRYTEDHEWIRVENDGHAYVGITDYAQKELDELVYVEVTTVGEHLEKGKVFGTVEAVKVTSELFMPVSGTVLEFNPLVSDDRNGDPTLINRDPYDQGWIIKIKLSATEELNDLLDAEQYEGSLH